MDDEDGQADYECCYICGGFQCDLDHEENNQSLDELSVLDDEGE